MAARRVDLLDEVLRSALRPHINSSARLDTATEAALDALRESFTVAPKRSRPRRETQRAQLLRLPAVGVTFEHVRKGKRYVVRIVGPHMVECEHDDRVDRYETLKAVAVAICGYVPPQSGWAFFFGPLSPEEVSARYGRKGG